MPASTSIPDKYKDHIFTVFAFGEMVKVRMVAATYGNNGRLRLDLITIPETPEDFEEPYGTLTTNITADDPGEDAFFVKTWSENGPLSVALIDSGVFEEVEHPREITWKFKTTLKFSVPVTHTTTGWVEIEAVDLAAAKAQAAVINEEGVDYNNINDAESESTAHVDEIEEIKS